MTEIISVAIYARVSTDKQTSDNQLIELRSFCDRHGYNIYEEYIDIISGAKDKNDRSGFKKLFDDANKRKFDLVLFWSLDRFSREGALKTLNYLNTLTSYGVDWKSYSEQYLDSTGLFKDAVISILATIAKQERVRISERTKAGLKIAKTKGKVLGRPKINDDKKEKVIFLRRSGLSFRNISKKLNISIGSIHNALKD